MRPNITYHARKSERNLLFLSLKVNKKALKISFLDLS